VITEAALVPVVKATGLTAGYAEGPVIRDIDLHVMSGEVVALLGPNGAGKTTTLLTIAGELKPTGGEVHFEGMKITTGLHTRARRGLAFVTEERSVFMDLTTAENLRVGRCDVDYALGLFPELAKRIDLPAGSLSGGEQQMLTLARALARRPKLLLADELSLGLAPQIVSRLLDALRAAADEGMSVLLVEQHTSNVLEIADRVVVLRRGRVELAGTTAELSASDSRLHNAYFGEGS
jgi:ABC-type branched-subunit amino acid transport system ATPase component